MTRLIAIAAASLAALAATPALATAPSTERVLHEDHFIDEGATDACGFPVVVDVRGILTIQVLFDAAGSPTRVQLHGNLEGTFSANGIVLRQIERGSIFSDLIAGTETNVGAVFRVFLPAGGSVIADVGRLVFSADGTAIFEAGPHPALHGDFDALCAALTA
jgi:hypothetical protein